MDREFGMVQQAVIDIKEGMSKQDIVLRDQNAVLKEISKKLDYTNGKVRNHDFWIRAVKWGAGIIATIVVMVMPFAIKLLSERIAVEVEKKVSDGIEERVEEILSTYEFDSLE